VKDNTEDLVKLTFRPLADDVPVAIRLRQLLKHALRALRLRCVCVEDVDSPKAGAAGQSGTGENSGIAGPGRK
jgi:hypothetical protein